MKENIRAIQNLVKGEPDWHEKINANTTDLDNRVKVVSSNVDTLSKDKVDKTTMNEKVNKKLILNGEVADTSFNLVEDKVVQDGLVYALKEKISTTQDAQVDDSDCLDISFDFFLNNNRTKTTYLLGNYNSTSGNMSGFTIGISHSTNLISLFHAISPSEIIVLDCKLYAINGMINSIRIIRNNNKWIITLNGQTKEFPYSAYRNGVSLKLCGYTSSVVTIEGYLEKVSIYNRPLTPQEIQHNLQVLNNSPSISHIETADAQSNKQEFTLASDSEHVTMQNGYNAEEAYTSLAKTMAKEFVSTNGSPVTVNNGIDRSKILSGEIQGQTVKNYLDCTKEAYYNGTLWYTPSSGIPYTFTTRPDVSKRYVIGFRVVDAEELNTSNKITSGSIGFRLSPFGSQMVSFNVGEFKFTPVFNGAGDIGNYIIPQNCKVKIKDMILVESTDLDKVKSFFVGLSSTQAIIENNGMKYPFYEPTIKGETVVKGGKLVSLESTDASLPKLGSVPSVSDTLDLASGVLNTFSEEKTYIGNEAWSLAENRANTIRFNLSVNYSVANTSVYNDKLPNQSPYGSDVEGVHVLNGSPQNLCVGILKSKLTTPDVNGFKQWLQANPTTIRYQLATPTQTQLTPAQVDTYKAHKKVISLNKVGDVADNLTLNDDGSSVWNDSSNDIILTGNETSWVLAQTFEKCLRFGIGTSDGIMSNNSSIISVISDRLEGMSWSKLTNDNEGISITPTNGSIGICVEKTKLQTQDLDGFKKWLSENNIAAKYQIRNQATTHIPKSITPTIPTGKENIISVGESVSASSFTVNVPTNDTLATTDITDALGGQISILSGVNSQSYATKEQLDGLVNTGEYTFYPSSNITIDNFTFSNGHLYSVTVSNSKHLESNTIRQIITKSFPSGEDVFLYRTKTKNSAWGAFKQLATTEKIEILNSNATITDATKQIKMLNGWEKNASNYNCSASKVGNAITLVMFIKNPSTVSDSICLKMPNGWTPLQVTPTLGASSDGSIVGIDILPTGDVKIWGTSNANRKITIQSSYVVG